MLNAQLDRGEVGPALETNRELLDVLTQRYGENNRSVIEFRAFGATLQRWQKLAPESSQRVMQARRLFQVGEQRLGDRDFLNAREHFLESHRIFEQTLGTNSIMTASSLRMIATAEFQLKRYREARNIFAALLETEQALLGEKHSKFALTLNDLGSLNTRLGFYPEAESQLREALQIREDVFGKDSVSYAATLSNLADLAAKRGEAQQARRWAEEAYAIANERRTEEPYVYTSTLWVLGRCSRLEGNLVQAEQHFRTALDYYDGLRHPPVEIVELLDEYIGVLRELGRNKEATTFQTRADKLRHTTQSVQARGKATDPFR